MTVLSILGKLANPAIPADIGEEYTLQAAHRTQRQGRLLMLGMMAMMPFALFDTRLANGGSWLPYIPPAFAFLVCAAGFLLLRKMSVGDSVTDAQRFLARAGKAALVFGLLVGIWGLVSWLLAAPDTRGFYALFLALVAMAVSFSLASLQHIATATLAIILTPIDIALFSSGELLDLSTALGLIIAGVMMAQMIHNQHHSSVELLALQKQARKLAETDPLTGLLNRKALLRHAVQLGGKHGDIRLLLLNIDQFETINQQQGQATGDDALRAIATILARRARKNILAARAGGTEFALIGPTDELFPAVGLALLAEIRNTAMPHGKQVTASIGCADGMVGNEADWHKLVTHTDEALFRARKNGGNQLIEAGAQTSTDTSVPTMAPARAATA
ncbi:MAG: diguanylate cyclase [Sphingomonadaceae bacterium]|nr:diguanylate cyclase [Sphingomonadaceae bacterium]